MIKSDERDHSITQTSIVKSISKKNKDWSQLIVILISALIAYGLFDPNPGEQLNSDLVVSVAITSVLLLALLLIVTYFLQKWLAMHLGNTLHYEFWPWSVLAAIVVTVVFLGRFPFYMPGFFSLNKLHGGPGKRYPAVSRVESAAVAGVGASLGLFIGLIFIDFKVISNAAVVYAIWNMLPIPKTNGFHFFNWHPLHGMITGVMALLLLFMHIISGAPAFLIVIAIVYLPYHWLYIFVLAKRTGY